MSFDLIREVGEVAFLAKTDESFREAFELIPHDTDVFRLFRVDAAVRGGLADGGELPDHPARRAR